MEIKKSSWHYKIVDAFSEYSPPDNLCNYFWRLVGSIVLSLIVGAILLGILFCMTVAIIYRMDALMQVGLVIWTGIALLLLFSILDKIKARRTPSLLSTYWKAFKGKYCPKITFKD